MTTILFLAACANITAIDDGRQVGDVVVLKDLFTSVQVLDAGERVVLFDGGYRSNTIRKQLESQGHSLADITDVFVTHGHSDHLDVIPDLPNANVYAFAVEAKLIEEESKGDVRIGRELQNGEVITVGNTTIEVFSVPGHTSGSAVFLTGGGALILGDTVRQSKDEELIINDGKYTGDPDQLLKNLRTLADTLEPRQAEVKWLVPAHTGAMKGLAPLNGL